MTDVNFAVHEGTATVQLNRPRTINSLTLGMYHAIHDQLLVWQDDDAVRQILLTGAGDRGFCAGGDIKLVREAILADPDQGFEVLRTEYELDAYLAEYPKPITAHLTGVSMGGGLGITVHGAHCIGDATSQLAMPEVGIGLWPDVGMTHRLARCPGRSGEYLAMTGATIDAASALYAGWLDEAEGCDPNSSELATDQAWIDECFAAEDADDIMATLAVHDHPKARAAAELISTRSPFSVVVALTAVRRARQQSLTAVFAQDAILASHFVRNPDFLEGVRALVVDKDRNPRWRHESIAAVPRDEVAAFFQPR